MNSWGWLAIALGIVLATTIAAHSWVKVRMHRDRKIEVTGSAKRRIMSDLIKWDAHLATQEPDRTGAVKKLSGYTASLLDYLKAEGITEDELSVLSATSEQTFDTEYVGYGEERVEKQRPTGFRSTQTVSVKSADVAKVERVSRQVTQLMERGIPVASYPPAYYYTKLGELKIEMLSEAAKDCRTRADKIVGSTRGAKIGRLRAADMGVININPPDSTETSWDGNNDTSSLDKDIITVVHCSFDLDR